jgi:hypothetical protein
VPKRASLVLGLTLALLPATASQAQHPDSVLTLRAAEVLVRIRRATSSDVIVARSLADSLVRALPANATIMPEALFAKASIAASAADAETDYSRITNDYRFSPRVPDALMRLALLEGARNNRTGALRHLDRLLRDHSESAVRSRASLMAGRLRMEMNDPARGCELLAAAWASAGLNERDVKDQAESLGAKCPTSIADRAQRDPSPLGIMRAARESVPSAVIVGAAQTAASRKRQRDSVIVLQAAMAIARKDSIAKAAAAKRALLPPTVVRRDTAPTVAVIPTVRRDTVPKPQSAAVIARRDTAPAPRPVAPVARPEPSAPVPTAAMRYAVQFAAYNDRPGALQFAQTLQRRGIAARVEGEVKPFRVRAGRFTTREEAEATLSVWARPGQQGIVVSYP